jgi:hypothetical protein
MLNAFSEPPQKMTTGGNGRKAPIQFDYEIRYAVVLKQIPRKGILTIILPIIFLTIVPTNFEVKLYLIVCKALAVVLTRNTPRKFVMPLIQLLIQKLAQRKALAGTKVNV